MGRDKKGRTNLEWLQGGTGVFDEKVEMENNQLVGRIVRRKTKCDRTAGKKRLPSEWIHFWLSKFQKWLRTKALPSLGRIFRMPLVPLVTVTSG